MFIIGAVTKTAEIVQLTWAESNKLAASNNSCYFFGGRLPWRNLCAWCVCQLKNVDSSAL